MLWLGVFQSHAYMLSFDVCLFWCGLKTVHVVLLVDLPFHGVLTVSVPVCVCVRVSCRTKGLNAEEQLVYQVIKTAGNTGWYQADGATAPEHWGSIHLCARLVPQSSGMHQPSPAAGFLGSASCALLHTN